MRTRELLIERLVTADQDYASLLEGEAQGWTDEDDDGADRIEGEANWVVYLPSAGRAVWLNNGDPVWYEASSLEDAVEIAQSGDPDRMIN